VHGGYLVEGRGDGIHAAFATADAAVCAAVEAQRALAEERWAVSDRLRVRMGLHTGDAELRDGDNPDVIHALGLLAKLRAGRGERTGAIEALREGVVRADDSGQVPGLLSYVFGYGVGVAADLDASEFAATLGGALTDGPLAWMGPWRPCTPRRPRRSPRPRPGPTRPGSLRRGPRDRCRHDLPADRRIQPRRTRLLAENTRA